MSNERIAKTLQIALASYDLKELRVQKHYLEEQNATVCCTCYRNGQKLLQRLRQGVYYNVVVLYSELEDMTSLQFVEQMHQQGQKTRLILLDEGRDSYGTALKIDPEDGLYCCVERLELKKLLWEIYRMPGQQNQQLEQRCGQLYQSWGIPQSDINAAYLSRAVSIVCSTSQKLAIRKEILQTVSEQFDTSVTAVDSGIRRMVEQLEAKPVPAWEAFKAENGLGSGKPTTGKLIYAVRSFVLRQNPEK